MIHLSKLNENTPLALLAYRINQHQETINGYTRNRLRVALDQGDALTWAKARLGGRKWKEWRQTNCPKVAERTDVLHRRLAAHRARIEQELATNPDLGVVEAVKLISTPKPPKSKPCNKAIVNMTNAISTEATTEVVAKPTVPASIKILSAPTYPMTDANRATVIDLALTALNVSRRPVSAPNLESIQNLLRQIITAAKVVTRQTQPPALDTTLFNKAMGVAA
jgi:hypothetical protein